MTDTRDAPEAHGRAGPAGPHHATSSPAAGPAAGSAATDWEAMAQRGRYDLAAQAYRYSGGTDGVLHENLEALSDALAAIRDKAWRRADTALGRVEHRHEALPWDAIDSDVAALAEANAALDRREAVEAREHLSRASGGGFPAEAATLMGTLAIYEGDTGRARERFEAALELDPNHYRALTNLGNLQLEDGDVDAAIDSYQKAIRLNDGFANAHHNLGVAYRRKGMIAQSVRSLRRAQREGSKRDAQEARARLGRRRPGAVGSARTVRWILIVAMAAAAYWFFVARVP